MCAGGSVKQKEIKQALQGVVCVIPPKIIVKLYFFAVCKAAYLNAIKLGDPVRIIIFLLLFTMSFGVLSDNLAQEANENPFLNGELNPKYDGQLTALSGDIIEIIEGNKGRMLYKLNLNIEGIKPIWVTSIAPFAKGNITINSKLIFRGYIALSDDLDSTGSLRSKIKSGTLLLALKAEPAL